MKPLKHMTLALALFLSPLAAPYAAHAGDTDAEAKKKHGARLHADTRTRKGIRIRLPRTRSPDGGGVPGKGKIRTARQKTDLRPLVRARGPRVRVGSRAPVKAPRMAERAPRALPGTVAGRPQAQQNTVHASVVLPSFIGWDLEDARQYLAASNLIADFGGSYRRRDLRYEVVNQIPSAGATVILRGRVTFEFRPRRPAAVLVPDVGQKTLREAATELRRLGFQVTTANENRPASSRVVRAQVPRAGKAVLQGQRIYLFLQH